MTSRSDHEATTAIRAAQDLDRALLPVIGEYQDSTYMAASIQAWHAAGVADALHRTRALIDRALKNLERDLQE